MANDLEHDQSYYYSDIQWRYTGVRPTAFGLDPSIVLLIPLTFITLARGWPTWFFGLYVLYFLLAIYVRWKGHPSIMLWLASLRTRAQGVKWPTR